MQKARSHFSYQVSKGQLIITGGVSSNGDIMKSTEVIDCNNMRGEPLRVFSDK